MPLDSFLLIPKVVIKNANLVLKLCAYGDTGCDGHYSWADTWGCCK
jgi:hypothetical protein